jgi:hypothetical protein
MADTRIEVDSAIDNSKLEKGHGSLLGSRKLR